mmetsp:Transcript_36077/g.72640  ORF Transcript_36077/g.72640 Transcript_36077/m.72640 type:complete len:255 (+) Transcript_36077:153-917(+)
MGLRCIDLAEHFRCLLDVWDHQAILQHTRRVDDSFTHAHLALRDGQRGRHCYVLNLHAQVCDLLGERRRRLRDVLDCRDTFAARLLFELGDELGYFVFPVLDLLLVGRGDRGAELGDRHRGLGGADHLLLDLLHGLERGLHQVRRHVCQLPLCGIDDIPQCDSLLCQKPRSAEGLESVVHHGTVGAVRLDHVVGALRLHGRHELQQLRGHARWSATSGGSNHLVLARHGKLVRRQHAEPAQAARNESHYAWAAQ